MMKHFLSAICLILMIFCQIDAQEIASRSITAGGETRNSAVRPVSVSESNYFNQLALRGFSLDTQGLLIESLDGRNTYAELNSNVGFNPASVIKVATTFAALSKFGPDYHFETGFYAEGAINKKTRTLNGNLILQATGDPVLSSIDVSRLIRDVVRAGISRVNGNLVVTGPFSYGMFYTTDKATKGLALSLRRIGIRFNETVNGGTVRGEKISSHASSSLREIVLYQNEHSVNQTAERLGEAVGGPKGVEQFLIKDLSIAPNEISISHTSGLDYNRITPRATVQLFRELVFWLNLNNLRPDDILPVAGVDAGTLARRFTGEEYRGAIIGKTGTLPGTDGGVSTLAGIAYTRDRGPVLFAIFNTKGSVATYRKLQDSFLKGFIVESGGIPETTAVLHRLNN
ncbi:MAG TPA: D-alanyl-D-alanine carboxypeptidase [Terriglobia bacterium]|nr:D-alanyl-D-alanine carboxypeptidase [Terriglobia bacterium]